jgi:hypothetical protein
MIITISPETTVTPEPITTPAVTVEIDTIEIIAVRDLFESQTIIARIKGLPQSVILWSGSEEYAAAGNWTNESVYNRAVEVLSLPSVPWAV